MIVLYKSFQKGFKFRILFPTGYSRLHFSYSIICFCYSISFQFGVDSGIYFCGLYTHMSKDVPDDNQANSRLEQMHCSGVSETVRRDVSGKKLWISDLGRFNMFFYYVSKACRCKLSTPHVVEKWMLVVLRPIKSMLSHICHYKIEDVLVKRDAPFLTAFAKEFCKIWFRCSDRGWCQICQFLCPRTCIIQDGENCMITSPTRSREINTFQQLRHSFYSQVLNCLLCGSFCFYGYNGLPL